MKRSFHALLILLITLSSVQAEGMYPLSELAGLDLAKQGPRLTPEEVFNPEQTGLIDGICKVNGCQGHLFRHRG